MGFELEGMQGGTELRVENSKAEGADVVLILSAPPTSAPHISGGGVGQRAAARARAARARTHAPAIPAGS